MASDSLLNVPASTSSWQRRSYSCGRPVAPVDLVRFGPHRHLLDPGQQALVLGGGGGGGVHRSRLLCRGGDRRAPGRGVAPQITPPERKNARPGRSTEPIAPPRRRLAGWTSMPPRGPFPLAVARAGASPPPNWSTPPGRVHAAWTTAPHGAVSPRRPGRPRRRPPRRRRRRWGSALGTCAARAPAA